MRHLEGNRSKTAIPAEIPFTGVPLPPAWLCEPIALEFFNRIAAQLSGVGVAKEIDTDALATLSDYWARWHEARKELAQEWTPVRLRAYLDAGRAWERLCGRFGLTPSDRVRLSIGDGEKPDEAEERFFKVTG